MQKASRLTAAQRNRALGRLRSFTVGTALASTAATGAFGYLAVVTNPGQQVTGSTTSTTTLTGSTAGSNSTTGSRTTSGSTATATPAATAGLRSSTTGTTTTTRRAHVTSGGS